ncbi:MAG: hypothetical protein JW902_12665 [Syntrophaceae bacterium]|nr:hypothetical protein [Syntrophaceae bacterium]
MSYENGIGFVDRSPESDYNDIVGQREKNASFRGGDAIADAPITLEEAYHGTSRLLQVGGQKIKVTIKPGTPDLQILRIPGKGTPGYNGGAPGDLLINVKILPHSVYERRNNDLHRAVPVELYTALLGGTVHVKSLKDAVNLKIPAETGNGQVLKMIGLGMPVFGHKEKFGDLYARVEIQIPKNLNSNERDLFGKLQEIRMDRRK